MRITRITVEELFGNPTYNYDISLKIDPDSEKRSSITILHGRNGSGKTVIFKMLAGLFRINNYSPFIFWKYPFRKFEIAFDDNSKLSVIRNYSAKKLEESFPTISYSKGRGRPSKYVVGESFVKGLPPAVRRDMTDDELIQTMASRGEDDFDAETLWRSERGFRFRLSDRVAENEDEHQFLNDLRSKLDIHFVNTDRLLIRKQASEDRPSARLSRGREITSAAAIEENSNDLKRRISEVIFTANTTDNDLNRSFPSNVVKSELEKRESWSYDLVATELEELRQRRERLVDAGLLDSGDELNVEEYSDDTLGRVLKLYIEDSKTKLKVYDGLAEKISLFKEILQEMLNDKYLIISKEGYQLKSDPDSEGEIPSKDLSSGEQHLIVLMYNLLFRDREQQDELILIDEPEISLHIAWQKRFVSSLEKISKLSNFDILIATHSPAIINGRWELEVSLHDHSN